MKQVHGFIAFFLFFAVSGLFGQVVSISPVTGARPDTSVMLADILQRSLEETGYTPQMADPDELSPDVPPGGFPPYMCPNSSITKDAPYALTGEMLFNDRIREYYLRMYLWETSTEHMVFSDEMIASTRSDCENNLPPLLVWLFSHTTPERADIPPSEPPLVETPPFEPAEEHFVQEVPEESVVEETKEETGQHWLYAGLRVGTALRIYKRDIASPFAESEVHSLNNIAGAVQVSLLLTDHFGIQVESIFTTDYAPFTDSAGNNLAIRSMSFMFPVLAKINVYKKTFSLDLLGGIYSIVPVGQMKSEAAGESFYYSKDPLLGYTVGIDAGIKAGPGYFFWDVRWAQDLGKTVNRDGIDIYKRGMVSLQFGYEIGILKKTK